MSAASFSFKSNGQVFNMKARKVRVGYVATGRVEKKSVRVILREIEGRFYPTLRVKGSGEVQLPAKRSAEKAFSSAARLLAFI